MDEQLNVYETFIRLYQIKETTWDTLCKLLLNVLLEKQLDITNLRSQTYDGTANMTGRVCTVLESL